MNMTTIIIVFVVAFGLVLMYQYVLASKTNQIIVDSFNELQDEKNSFKWLLDRTQTTDYLAWEELYDRCKEKGIEKYITLDDTGKRNIRGILMANLKDTKD